MRFDHVSDEGLDRLNRHFRELYFAALRGGDLAKATQALADRQQVLTVQLSRKGWLVAS